MITPELISFIKGEIAKGKIQEQIKSELTTGGGWTLSDIEEGFKNINNPVVNSIPANTKKYSGTKLAYVLVFLLVLGFSGSAYFFRADLNRLLSNVPTSEKTNNVTLEDTLKVEDGPAVEDPKLDTVKEETKTEPPAVKNTMIVKVPAKTTSIVNNLMLFTSKTHKFSFYHDSKYLNETETMLAEQNKSCPSGDLQACNATDLEKLRAELQTQCATDKYNADFGSPEVCVKTQMELFTGFIQESEDDFQKKLNSPVDLEGDDKFSAYRGVEGEDPDAYYDYFSYGVSSLDKPLLFINYSPESCISADLKSKIPYAVNPTITFTYSNGKILRKALNNDTEYWDYLSKGEINKLPVLYTIEIEPYLKNSNGVSFYKLDKDHTNMYCAISIKAVCFNIYSNIIPNEKGNEADKALIAREKAIMKPIEESLKFLP